MQKGKYGVLVEIILNLCLWWLEVGIEFVQNKQYSTPSQAVPHRQVPKAGF